MAAAWWLCENIRDDRRKHGHRTNGTARPTLGVSRQANMATADHHVGRRYGQPGTWLFDLYDGHVRMGENGNHQRYLGLRIGTYAYNRCIGI